MLEEYIVDLLLRHNCVVVPAFGGFVAQSSGAIIDLQSGSITPPRKSVLFNKQLINNDGLLLAHISNRSNMEYSAAELFLKAKVEEWQTKLKDGKRVSIDKIGHLYLDAERNISFEQDRYFNLLLQSYGLNKVHFISEEDVKLTEAIMVSAEKEESKSIISPVVEEKILAPVEGEETKVISIASENSGSRKLWKYVAAAAMLPIAFFTYWIPVQTNVLESGMISFKDFNPTYHAGEGIYQESDFTFSTQREKPNQSFEQQLSKVPESAPFFKIKFDDELELVVSNEVMEAPIVEKEIQVAPVETKVEAKPVVEQKEVVKPIQKPAATKATSKNTMHYIAGCFSDRENANAMVATMKERGLNAYILDENKGMLRVSAGGATSQEEFDKVVKKAQAIGYQGWKLD